MGQEAFVHETACIDAPCHLGEGTRIWHFSHVMAGARIGTGCNIGQNVYVDADVVIGDSCKIQNNVSVYKGVTLEDGVFCGPSVVFTNVINPRALIERKHELRPTMVQRGATLGANARRTGLANSFGLGVLLCFAYYSCVKAGQALGWNQFLDPWLGAWLANLIFAGLALTLLWRAHK